MHQQTRLHLQHLQHTMTRLALWQSMPPNAEAFLSEQPFALDTMDFYSTYVRPIGKSGALATSNRNQPLFGRGTERRRLFGGIINPDHRN